MNLADFCQGIINVLNLSTGGIGGILAGQMGKIHFWAAGVVIIVLGIAYRIYRVRIQGADYEITSKNTEFILESELGTFVFDQQAKSVKATYVNKQEFVFQASDIRDIQLITEDVDALMSEIVFEGWDPFIDTEPKYRDVQKKYSIVMVTNTFKRYPIMLMQQYRVKDILAFGYEAQLGFLEMFGLYTPIEEYSQKIYAKLKSSLEKDFNIDERSL